MSIIIKASNYDKYTFVNTLHQTVQINTSIFGVLKNTQCIYDSQEKRKRCSKQKVQKQIVMKLFSGCYKITKYKVQLLMVLFVVKKF